MKAKLNERKGRKGRRQISRSFISKWLQVTKRRAESVGGVEVHRVSLCETSALVNMKGEMKGGGFGKLNSSLV